MMIELIDPVDAIDAEDFLNIICGLPLTPEEWLALLVHSRITEPSDSADLL